jgi:hypothetical protein
MDILDNVMEELGVALHDFKDDLKGTSFGASLCSSIASAFPFPLSKSASMTPYSERTLRGKRKLGDEPA